MGRSLGSWRTVCGAAGDVRRAGPPGAAGGLAPEVAAVLWGVQPEFLMAAFEAVESDHGSLDTYLREALGLGVPEQVRLRSLYLQA